MRSLPSTLALIGVALFATTAPTAAAPESSSEDKAKIHFAAGREHYENGRYEAAITEFEAAQSLTPKPELRYNLYLANERLGKLDVALAHLEAYLAEGQVEPAERAQLEARREALRQRVSGPAAPPPPARADDVRSGFIARVALGLGYASAQTDIYEVTGSTGDLLLAVGWMVTGRLGLHLTAWGGSMVGANIRAKDGLGSVFLFRDDDVRYTTGAVGVGGTWFLPHRFYGSASLGAATVSAERGGAKAESDLGPALLLLVGKDWRLAGNLNIGAALSFSLLSVPEQISETAGARHDNKATVFMFGALGALSID